MIWRTGAARISNYLLLPLSGLRERYPMPQRDQLLSHLPPMKNNPEDKPGTEILTVALSTGLLHSDSRNTVL